MFEVKSIDDTDTMLSRAPNIFSRPHGGQTDYSRLALLYEKGKLQQWSAAADLDWDVESCFGSRLPEDSNFALGCFETSPLASYGRGVWDAFRWEFQSWMISQFLPGEQAALTAASRLMEVAPSSESRLCFVAQAADEARHVEVFERYLREKVPAPYPVSPSLAALLRNALGCRQWDFTVLGLQILVEAVALAAFRLADRSFHDKLIRDICRLVARDEARHVSLGVLSLRSVYADMTAAELKDREEFIMAAIELLRERFLLGEVWERMGINRHDGELFATTNELMIRYRQTICVSLVNSLITIGLMTRSVTERFVRLGLLGPSHRSWTNRILRGLA